MPAYRGAPRMMGGVRALGETNLLTRMAGSGNGAVLLLTKIRISEDLHESAFRTCSERLRLELKTVTATQLCTSVEGESHRM